jgi:tripartite-type tricarboxylate transporter receptor subunit TctC
MKNESNGGKLMKKMDCITRRLLLAAALAAVTLTAAPAFAQDAWPKARPIKAVVPFGAGSSTDIIARLIMEETGKNLGQTIVVENRGGASGTIGANAVAKSDPDGYTILVHSSSHTVTPSTVKDSQYNAETDFVAVTPLTSIPNVVVVNPAKGYKTLKDMVDALNKNKGKANYASAGAGSATHLTAERLKLSAKIEGTHVPYKGSAEAIADVVADRVDFYCSPVNAAIGLIKDNRLQALAVSSNKRAAALPNVPTTVEAGYPDSGYEFWIGALLPKGTPNAIRDQLHAAIVKAMKDPGVTEKLAKLGADSFILSPAEFEAMIKKEIAANAVLVKAAGLEQK